MTDSLSFSPRFLPSSSDGDVATRSPATTRQHSPQRPSWRHGSHAPFVLTEDRTSQAVLLGLFTVTLPAMVYAFAQLWSLVGGKTLTHAIQAFAS